MESLYRYYNAQGELLYIGISSQYAIRAAQHSKKSPWYAESANVTIEHCRDREDALLKEKKAIRLERPKYNKLHNGWKGSAQSHYQDMLLVTRPLKDDWHSSLIDLALENYEMLIAAWPQGFYFETMLAKAFEQAMRELTQSGGDTIENLECGGCEKVITSGFFNNLLSNFMVLAKESSK